MKTKTKLNDLEEAARLLKTGVEWGALKIASGLKRLDRHRNAIQKAYSALQHPDFYEQLGQDPTKLVSDGIRSLEELIVEKVH